MGKPSSAGRRTDIPSGPERPVGQDDTAPPPQDGDSSNSTSIDQNPLDAQADPDADRARLKADEDAARIAYQPARTLDAGKESIEDSPLFGGSRQGDMFAEEDPQASTAPQPLSTLAGAARGNRNRTYITIRPPRSKLDKLTLGAATFAKTDVLPTVGNAAAAIVEASDDILKVLAPTMRSNDAKLGALVLRARLGELARKYDTAEHALRLAWKMFEKQQAAENFDFIHRIETGQPQPTPELQKIADLFRTMLDQRRTEVQVNRNPIPQFRIQPCEPRLNDFGVLPMGPEHFRHSKSQPHPIFDFFIGSSPAHPALDGSGILTLADIGRQFLANQGAEFVNDFSETHRYGLPKRIEVGFRAG